MFLLSPYQKLIKWITVLVLIFCAFCIKIDADFDFLLCECLFVLFLYFILYLLGAGIFKYVFEPPVIFLIFTFVYEFLKFPYYFNFDSPQNLMNKDLVSYKYRIDTFYSNSSKLLLYEFASIGLLLFGYFSIKKNAAPNFTSFKFTVRVNLLLFISFILMIGSAAGLYYATGGNPLLLLTRRAGNTDASELLKGNYVISLADYVAMVTLTIVIAFAICRKQKWRRYLFLYIPTAILYYIITTSRGTIIFSIFSLLVVGVSTNAIKISIPRIAISLAVVILLFGALGVVRRSMTDTSNMVSNLKDQAGAEDRWYSEITGYQLQLRDEVVYAHADDAGLLFGESYLNLIFFPIPRDWIGDLKPEFIDHIVGVNLFNRDDVGLPLNAMGESYYNFSFFGVFVFIIIGFVMGLITKKLLHTQKVSSIIIFLILLIYAQTWSTTYILYVFQFLTIMSIPLFLIKKKPSRITAE